MIFILKKIRLYYFIFSLILSTNFLCVQAAILNGESCSADELDCPIGYRQFYNEKRNRILCIHERTRKLTGLKCINNVDGSSDSIRFKSNGNFKFKIIPYSSFLYKNYLFLNAPSKVGEIKSVRFSGVDAKIVYQIISRGHPNIRAIKVEIPNYSELISDPIYMSSTGKQFVEDVVLESEFSNISNPVSFTYPVAAPVLSAIQVVNTSPSNLVDVRVTGSNINYISLFKIDNGIKKQQITADAFTVFKSAALKDTFVFRVEKKFLPTAGDYKIKIQSVSGESNELNLKI